MVITLLLANRATYSSNGGGSGGGSGGGNSSNDNSIVTNKPLKHVIHRAALHSRGSQRKDREEERGEGRKRREGREGIGRSCNWYSVCYLT